ncbi:hypothetical protein [Macrococcus armenti]|uniref:Uncharacterized protein n=1 Tax=Macrococcus armenti TaxID=2875764 RepID=A0ABY3ZTL1_9STAP|nr:hypothetical protein [Macrococcus armenti]UOB20236.1 hypothetical protein MRZ06_09575 [Macrococcus armenti]
MVHQQFKKIITIMFIIFFLFILWAVLEYVYNHKLNALFIGLSSIIYLIIAIIYINKYKHSTIEHKAIVTDDIVKYKKFVITNEVAFNQQLLIYSEDGKFLGRFKSLNTIKSFIITTFISNKGLVPGEYVLIDAEQNEILRAYVKGFLHPKVKIIVQNKEIAVITQKLFNAAMSFVYEINTNDEKHVIKSEVLTNDLYLEDVFKISETKVPLQHTEKFQEVAMNTYEIFHNLNTDKGKTGLVMMCIHNILTGR